MAFLGRDPTNLRGKPAGHLQANHLPQAATIHRNSELPGDNPVLHCTYRMYSSHYRSSDARYEDSNFVVPVTPRPTWVLPHPKRVSRCGMGHQHTTTGAGFGVDMLTAHNSSDLAPWHMPVARPRLAALTSPPPKELGGRGAAALVPVGGREATFRAFCRHSRGLSATARPKDVRLRPFLLVPACGQKRSNGCPRPMRVGYKYSCGN